MAFNIDPVALSRVVSHALRHEPWLYELELDEDGWVDTGALLAALRIEHPGWSNLSESDLAAMVSASEKKRHELVPGRIRALYGHSTPQKLRKERAAPPPLLYHGTAPAALDRIRVEGLRPMGRQFVHLSVDRAMARQVGARKCKTPVVLAIHADAAHAAGILFYRGNDSVWLADDVPPAFLDQA